MLRLTHFFGVCFMAASIVSCGAGSSYMPKKANEKTGLYDAPEIGAGVLQLRDVKTDLKRFRFVYLVIETNVYPARFEFLVRAALNDMGFPLVLNKTEMERLAKTDQRLSGIENVDNLNAAKQISDTLGPALRIEFGSRWDGLSRRTAYLFVTDLSGNFKELLRLMDDGIVLYDVDTTVHYPMLNELKKWVVESRAATGGGTL